MIIEPMDSIWLQAQKYIYTAIWDEDMHVYVGLCKEFPNLSYIDKEIATAYIGIQQAVENHIRDIVSNYVYIAPNKKSKRY